MSYESFVVAVNKKNLWYREELLDMLAEHDLHSYIPHITTHGMYRWYPSEVTSFMSLVDEAKNNNYPWVDASVKHIPDFLLKDSDD